LGKWFFDDFVKGGKMKDDEAIYFLG